MKLFEKYSVGVEKTISNQNCNRLLLMSVIVFVLHSSHIFTFHFGTIETVDSNAIEWRNGILNAHWVGLFASLFFFVISWVIYKIKNYDAWYVKVFPLIPMAFYLVFSIWIVTIDQIITTSISPYLLVCVGMGILFLFPPQFSLLIFTINYLIFHYRIPHFVSNTELILSNRVNALSFNLMSFGIQWAFWISTTRNLKQKELIDSQNENLEKDSAFKDKLFSIIGHDLKGPVSGIAAGLEFLQEEDLSDKEKNELIFQLKKSANSTYSLLENLLQWSLIQRGIGKSSTEKLHLNEKIEKAVNLLQPSALGKNIEITTSISGSIHILFDEKAFDTLLRNLLSNAIKFTPEGGKITIKIVNNSKAVQVEIKDSGIGMSLEQINKIQTGKINESRYGTAGEKGTGIGLILCREFLNQNNSTMTIDSKIGEGTKITLQIPMAN